MDTFYLRDTRPTIKDTIADTKSENIISSRIRPDSIIAGHYICDRFAQGNVSFLTLIYSSAWLWSPGMSFQSESEAEELSSSFSEIGVFSVGGTFSSRSFFSGGIKFL